MRILRLFFFLTFLNVINAQNVEVNVKANFPESLEHVKVVLLPYQDVYYPSSEGKLNIAISYGDYSVLLYNNGTLTARKEINIRKEESINVDFNLEDTERPQGIYKEPNEKLHTVIRSNRNAFNAFQQINSVNRELIDQQGIISLFEATQYIPGLYGVSNYGRKTEAIGMRGLQNVSVLKNGVQMSSNLGSSGIIDLQGIEDIQVIKTVDAITQGISRNGATGGIVNLVTKTPKMHNFGKVALQGGSWSLIRPTIDINRVITKDKLAVRVNGAFETRSGWQDDFSLLKTYVNPSIVFNPSKSLTINVDYDYLYNENTPIPGTRNISDELTKKEIKKLDNKVNFGFEKDYVKNHYHTFSARAKYNINELLALNANISGVFSSYESEYTRLHQEFDYVNFRYTDPKQVIRRLYHDGPQYTYNYVTQLDLESSKRKLGNFEYNYNLGVDYRLWYEDSQQSQLKQIDVFDITKDKPTSQRDDQTWTKNYEVENFMNSFGATGQFVIDYMDHISVLIGGRYSAHGINNANYTAESGGWTETAYDTTLHTFNPFFSVLMRPARNTNIVVSYSNTSDPMLAYRKDENGDALGSQRIDQYEFALKSKWLDNNLITNAYFYVINQNNMIEQAYKIENNTTIVRLDHYAKSGKQVNQGFEFEAIGQLSKKIQILANYAYNNAEYKVSGVFMRGSDVLLAPNNTINLWVNYKMEVEKLGNLSFGLGAYYNGKRTFNDQTITQYEDVIPGVEPWELDDYVILNAQVSLQYKRFKVHLFGKNLLNQHNYYSYRNNYFNIIDPINISGRVSYSF